MNLLLDMGVSPRSAEFLRAAGHDAVHLRERALGRLADQAIMQLAVAESRMVVTFDLDFSRILALQQLAAPSVIVFRLERYSTGQVNQILIDALAKFEAELLAGAIVVIDPSRIRVRRLPIL
jgi:predicted nuclease of predicted toxin-antitoxin system